MDHPNDVPRTQNDYNSCMLSMRDNYATYGVDGFYEAMHDTYRNPHYEQVKKICKSLMNEWLRKVVKPHYDPTKEIQINALDFACGSGEVTLALKEWSSALSELKINLKIVASDPFTGDAYKNRTGMECEKWSFEDVSNGALDYYDEDKSFDVVVISYALHLLEEGKLMPFCLQLALKCKYLIIISPHKKPHMKDDYGYGMVEQITMNRVHGRLFKSTLFY